MRSSILVALAVLLGAPGVPAQDKEDGLVVHEWGVTPIWYGSNTARPGAAWTPAFVQKWEDLVGRQIEEWKQAPAMDREPILYFYAPKKTAVSVRVSMPTGRPHAWWPPATNFGPQARRDTPDIRSIKPENGFLEWKDLVVDPAARPTREADGWWPLARKTDATPVGTGRENEKFLFYEALTILDPMVTIEWKKDSVVLRSAAPEAFPHAWAARVKDGRCRWGEMGGIKQRSFNEFDLNREDAPADFVDVLVAQGLYRKEAEALAEIWKKDFFANDGLRVLLVLPPEAYDRLLPLRIEPAPREIKRVMIVQIECLDEEREAEIRALIGKLGADDPAEREAATARLKSLRPLADGLLRKALEAETDPERRGRLEKLLAE